MAHSFVRSPPCNNGVPIFFNISFAAVSLSIVPILKEDNCSIVLPMISQLSSDDCRISMCYRITCLLWCVSPFLFFSPVIVVLHSMRRFDLLFGHVSSSAYTRPREKREGERTASVKRSRPRSPQLTTLASLVARAGKQTHFNR